MSDVVSDTSDGEVEGEGEGQEGRHFMSRAEYLVFKNSFTQFAFVTHETLIRAVCK